MPMRPAIRRLAFSLCLGALFLLLPVAATATEAQPATDPQAVLANAQKLYRLRQFSESAAEFERANQLSGGDCAECLFGLSGAYAAAGHRDRALATAREVLQLTPAPPSPLLASAYHLLAAILMKGPRGDKTLAEAEADLRKAVELDGNEALHRTSLATVLVMENRPAEALDLARPLATGWESDTARRAHALICTARADLPASPSMPLPPPQKAGDGDSEARRLTPDSSGPDAVTRPEILDRIQPQYTEEARKSGIEGTVILESIIDEEGCVTRVNVLKSLDPGLDKAATAALRHWTFKPAMKQGQPVKVYYSLTITFQVDKTPPRKPS